MEPLERQQLTAWVVQQLSDYGTVQPTVFLQLEAQQGQKSMVQHYRVSPWSGDARAKAVRLFELVREVGRHPQNRAREVLDLCLISEIWITPGPNPPPGKRPPGTAIEHGGEFQYPLYILFGGYFRPWGVLRGHLTLD